MYPVKARALLVGTLLLAMIFIVSCGLNQVEDPLKITGFTSSQIFTLSNQNDEVRTTFMHFETVFLDIRDLFEREQTNINIIRVADDMVIKRLVVVTDKDGVIEELPIWEEIGVQENGHIVDEGGHYLIQIIQPPRQEVDENFNPVGDEVWTNLIIPFSVTSLEEGALSPHLWAVNADGSFHGQNYDHYEPVYGAVSGMDPGTVVHFIVTPHKWVCDNPGDYYQIGEAYDIVYPPGNPKTAVVGVDGTIGAKTFWYRAEDGEYDLVVDTAPFGEYNETDLVSDPLKPHIIVQDPSRDDHIVLDMSMDEYHCYKDCFDSLEAVYIQAIPHRQPVLFNKWMENYSNWVPVYIMQHRDEWFLGDKLINIPNVGDNQMPIWVQADPYTGWVKKVMLRPNAKPNFMYPWRLWHGCYDIIVDINRDGYYTPGTDLLDGGPQVGFYIEPCDCEPGDDMVCQIIGSASSNMIGRDEFNTTVDVCVMLIDDKNNPIADVPVNFSLPRGPGMLSATMAMTDANGFACVQFSGGEYGVESRIREETGEIEEICDPMYTTITVRPFIPESHGQGVILGD